MMRGKKSKFALVSDASVGTSVGSGVVVIAGSGMIVTTGSGVPVAVGCGVLVADGCGVLIGVGTAAEEYPTFISTLLFS